MPVPVRRVEMGIDINDMLRKMLEARKAGISSEKIAVAEEEIAKAETREECGGNNEELKPQSRYISVKVRKILKQEYGDKCSIPYCNKPAKQIHHTQRYALAGVHDPRYMAPMCENHHKIAHSIDLKTREKWKSW
jgi:hypothetical protein